MIRGLYTAALGMQTQMKRMDVVSNNIANVDTTGFKRDISVTQSFSEELMKRLDDQISYSYKHDRDTGKVSQGVFVDDVHTDFSSGILKYTDNPLDIAISGDGFFVVDTPLGERYTKDGAFTTSSEGILITKDGYPVMGDDGPINISSSGEIYIDGSGVVSISGNAVGRIQCVDFENHESLRKIGNNLYATTNETVPREFEGELAQGCLESSNINAVSEMVEMIAISRAYEANQKVITMMDNSFGNAVSDIGRK